MLMITDWLRQLRFRLSTLFRKRDLEAEMAEEIRTHLEMEAEANQRTGMRTDEARYAALRQFGGPEQVKELCRAQRRWLSLEQIVKDIRLALRSLARSPGFTLVSIVTLSLGIAISTSSFSLTNLALLRALPFPENERLVRIFRTAPESSSLWHSPGNFLDLRAATSSFSHLTATYIDNYNVSVAEEVPEQTSVLHGTANFLATIGVQPVIGRGFADEEDQPGKGGVAILTNSYWQRKFQGDPGVIGRTLRVNSETLTVIGVLPPVFDSTPVWYGISFIRPLTIWPNYSSARDGKWFDLTAKLKPGVNLITAQTELSALAARFAKDDPVNNAGQGIRVIPLASSNIDENTRTIYWLITGLSLLVLVIACANLASLQLVRAFNRSHEMAIRAALGARRLALMTPLLAECLVLSALGGVGGVLLASWINSIITASSPGSDAVPLDGRVLLFAAVAALFTGVSFGLVPAGLASRVSPAASLKDAGRGSTGSRSQRRLKSLLIVIQLALAFVLVSAALSFTLAVRQSIRRDFGWSPDRLITGVVSLPYAICKDKALEREFTRSLRSNVGKIPGITRLSVSRFVPIYDYSNPGTLFVEGQVSAPPGQEPIVAINAIDDTFLDLLRIPLKEGRKIPADISPESPSLVLINESTARHFWSGQSALGKRMRLGADAKWAEVIGVVGDVRMAANFNSPLSRFQVYRALEQDPDRYYSFVVESTLPMAVLEKSIRQVIASIHPDIMVQQLGPIDQILHSAISENTVLIITLTAFAFAGLLIAVIGLYGLMAQFAMQRQREIGVRLALGADPRAIELQMLTQGGKLVIVGLALGLLSVSVVLHVFRVTMPELQLPGILCQLGIALVFTLVGLCACYLPTRRAGRVDPIIVLRA